MGERLVRRVVAGTTVVSVAFGTPRTSDAAEPCVSLRSEGAMARAWADAVDDLRRQLGRMRTGECQPITLVLASRGDVVRIVAIGQDGRRAERDVTQPTSLAPTALGLVLALPLDASDHPAEPEAPQGTAANPPPPSPSSPSPPGSATPAADTRTIPAPRPVAGTPPRSIHAWVGLAAGGRLSAPTSISMVDVEGRADVLLGEWLFLASFRYVPLGLAPVQGVDSDVYREIAVALGAGRRFALGRDGAVDVALSPSLIAMRLETDSVPGNESADQYANDIEFRLGVSARLALPMGQRWALTLTADTDVAPASLASPRHVGTLLPFPTWTGGLRLGAMGALL
jgi:hypothetical protein